MGERLFKKSLRGAGLLGRILLIAAAAFFVRPLPAAQAAEENAAGILIDSGSDFDVEAAGAPPRPGRGASPSVLVVDSRPAGAAVYVNYAYAGTTPLTLKDLKPGGYRVTLQRKNFKDASVYVTLDAGRTFRIFGRLRPETGTLRILPVPGDAEIYVNGARLWNTEDILPVGSYAVRVRRFGYEDFTEDVRVEEDRTTVVQAVLPTAGFAAEDFAPSRMRLNPDNPGLTGRSDLMFFVTAPGTGRLVLYDSRGQPVRTHSFPFFSTWKQSFRWDGRDDGERPLPDGFYRAVVDTESRDGKTRIRMETAILLDRSLVIRYRSLWHGQPGLLYAPFTSGLPAGSFQLGSSLLGMASGPGDGPEGLYFAGVGAVVGLSPRTEMAPLLSLALANEEGAPDISASLAVKRLLLPDGPGRPLSLSGTLRANFSSEPSYAGFSQFPGVTAGLVFGLRFGPLGLLLAPEVLASRYRAGDEVDTGSGTGFNPLFLARFGLYFETGAVMAGFSTVLAARPAEDSPRLQHPVHTGFEVHGLLPNSLLFVSASVSWEYSPEKAGRVFVGGGLGIIY